MPEVTVRLFIRRDALVDGLYIHSRRINKLNAVKQNGPGLLLALSFYAFCSGESQRIQLIIRYSRPTGCLDICIA